MRVEPELTWSSWSELLKLEPVISIRWDGIQPSDLGILDQVS